MNPRRKLTPEFVRYAREATSKRMELPTISELARQAGVARSVVFRAVRQLHYKEVR